MLNIYFGDMPEAIYNTAVYFQNRYLGRWITDDWGRRVIKDVDKSDVVGENLIQSPVLGAISPIQLSGGVKTLLLIAHEKNRVFNASTCGDNCARFILKLAKDNDITINLRHIMNFGKTKFTAKILNDGAVVSGMEELLFEAYKYV